MEKRKQPGVSIPELKSFTVRIPEKLIDRLKMRALQEHTSVQELAARALQGYLKQRGREGEPS